MDEKEKKDLEELKLQKEDRDKRIKAEVRRLNSLFSKMDKSVKKVVKSLIENVAFMAVTLADLQEHINIHGVTDKYQNGENQWGTKKSPEVEIHISMTKNHNSTMKQLADLLPKRSLKPEDDGFEDFENER